MLPKREQDFMEMLAQRTCICLRSPHIWYIWYVVALNGSLISTHLPAFTVHLHPQTNHKEKLTSICLGDQLL